VVEGNGGFRRAVKESRGNGCHAAIVLPKSFGKMSKLLTEVWMMVIVDAS
jgi:hypothetical protein